MESVCVCGYNRASKKMNKEMDLLSCMPQDPPHRGSSISEASPKRSLQRVLALTPSFL